MWVRVVRAFTGPDARLLAVGEVVNGADWPALNRAALLAEGWVIPVDPPAARSRTK